MDVEVRWRNFWNGDLSDGDVVFCYLFPDVMKALSAKLRSDLKAGAVVVSCNFNLPGFSPDRILRPGNTLHNDPIYIYRVHERDPEVDQRGFVGMKSYYPKYTLLELIPSLARDEYIPL